MTNNLKIEVLVSNIPEDGSIASQFPSQEYVNQQLAKKANLSPEGRLDPSQAPDYTEIPGLYEHIEDTKDVIETSIADSLQNAKGYTNQQLSTGLQTKADLVNGKIPFDQIPFSADIEDQIQINVENITAVVDQKVAQVVEQVNGVATAANSYTDTKVAETKAYVDTTVGNVIEDVERFGVSKAVTIPTYLTPEAGVAAGTGVAAGAYYNVRSTEDDTMLVEYQNVGGVPTPSGKSYPSSVAVRNIAKYAALPFVAGKPYGLHERVQLENGDIVKGAVDGNTVDPNVNMAGWLNIGNTGDVDSIADLLAIPNPKNGNAQRVKSFDVGFNIGGGHFTYDETKASINNGVTIFNGWVRNCNPNRVKASYAGLRGDENQDVRVGFKNLSDYLNGLNPDKKKHLKIESGIFQIETIQRYDSGQASYCTFAAVNNLSIVGDGKESTVFRFPDWVLDLIDGNDVIRDFAVFSDNQQNIKNFSVNHVGFDFNADNNYYRTDEESNGPLRKAAMAFKFVGYEFENLDFSNNKYYRNPFYNSVIVMAYKKPNGSSNVNNVKVNHCDFIRGGDGANLGLNKVHDHSSIFLAGKGLQAQKNSFVTVQGSNVSCGIEMHNYGVMSGNYFENYSVPLHAVSEEDMGCNIIASGNIALGAVYGLSHNCKDANSTITYVGNKIQLRGEKALFLPSNNGLTFRHGGYESGGGVNNATALHNHDTKVYLKSNTFEQLPPVGSWEWSDNIINACMAVKEVQVFEATDNTFIGFQGAALEILTNNGQQLRSNSRLLLRNNTYIRCGFSSNNADGFGDFNSAYRITGNGANLPYDLGILDVMGDKFIECKYGALVGNYLPEVFMNKISVSDVKVSGGFINPIFMKSTHINLQSACSISYSYQDTQDITYTPNLLSKGNVAFDLNITQEDAYGKPYFELQYKKTFSNPAVHLNAKGYGQVSGSQKIGFFDHAVGDTYTPLDTSYDQFSKFYYANVGGVNQWRGVSKVQ